MFEEVTTTKALMNAIIANNKNTVTNLLNKKVIPTVEMLCCAIENKHKDIIEILLNFNVPITEMVLVSACKIKSRSLIQKFISSGIIPTKACFDALLINFDNLDLFYDYDRDIMSTQDGIDFLITNDYKLTYEDVLQAMEKKIKINNIEKFNFVFDEKYMTKCVELNFFPYDIPLKCKPSTEDLEKACTKRNNMITIKKLIKQGAKPNSRCLVNVCKFNHHYQTMKFLINHGAIVDLECLELICNYYGNATLKMIFDNYKNNINNVVDSDIKKASANINLKSNDFNKANDVAKVNDANKANDVNKTSDVNKANDV